MEPKELGGTNESQNSEPPPFSLSLSLPKEKDRRKMGSKKYKE
jgi:hypothetical protein